MTERCSKPLLLVVVGPTGVGKTEFALRLAEHYHCSIINADSRQIYRDLPIGTAAPTLEEQARVPHFLVGTHALDETYNAGQFERDALALIGEDITIVSGGSMLYIDALCHGLDDIPEVSASLKEQVQQTYREKGLEWLQTEVQRLDPAYWQEVDQMNPARLIHCVEVSLTTGQPYSLLRKAQPKERPFEVIKLGLTRPREELYARIDQRVLQMVDAGLEEEARRAYRVLRTPTVGYTEFFRYFDGEISRQEAIRLIQQNSRHYAKRQLTWWRRDASIHWLDLTLDYEKNLHTVISLVHAARLQEG